MEPNPTTPAQPTSDERLWAMLSWLSQFVIAIVLSIVILLTKGKESKYVRTCTAEVINLMISYLIAEVALLLIGVVFLVLGASVASAFTAGWLVIWLLMLTVMIYAFVMTIIGSVKAFHGEPFRVPMIMRFVK